MNISILSAISLILGVAGMFLSFIYIGSFLCLVALVLGIVSLNKDDSGYKWPAVCAIACSAVGIFIVLALSVNFYHNNARRTSNSGSGDWPDPRLLSHGHVSHNDTAVINTGLFSKVQKSGLFPPIHQQLANRKHPVPFPGGLLPQLTV